MEKWNLRLLAKASTALAALLCACTLARADTYEDAVSKAFPGFQILARSEFNSDIQKRIKRNPSLITGHFNDDELGDFAAIVRETTASSGQGFQGKWIVCHGLGKGEYRCQVLRELPIFLPYAVYLDRMSPGKVECLSGEDSKSVVRIKKDAIGYEADNVAGVYVYRPDGSYRHCTTAD